MSRRIRYRLPAFLKPRVARVERPYVLRQVKYKLPHPPRRIRGLALSRLYKKLIQVQRLLPYISAPSERRYVEFCLAQRPVIHKFPLKDILSRERRLMRTLRQYRRRAVDPVDHVPFALPPLRPFSHVGIAAAPAAVVDLTDEPEDEPEEKHLVDFPSRGAVPLKFLDDDDLSWLPPLFEQEEEKQELDEPLSPIISSQLQPLSPRLLAPQSPSRYLTPSRIGRSISRYNRISASSSRLPTLTPRLRRYRKSRTPLSGPIEVHGTISQLLADDRKSGPPLDDSSDEELSQLSQIYY